MSEGQTTVRRPRSSGCGDSSYRIRVKVVQVAYGDDEPVSDRIDRVAALVCGLTDADLIVLPELWAHGGFASDTWVDRAEPLDGPVARAMSEAARAAGAVLHAGSIIERAPADAARAPEVRGLWNTSLLFGRDGALRATYRKVHRFGFGDGEPRLLDAGDRIVTTPLTGTDGCEVATIGLATCYDLRFPEMFRTLLDAGSDLFVVPAAWPAPRVEHWQLLGRARALENQSFLIQCNTAGTHSGVAMGGCSQVVSPNGVVLAQAGSGPEVLDVQLDLREVDHYRRSFPVLDDRRLGTPAREAAPA
ncbi:carbon-nitrogen family hydrolase [Geodermatophilus ruber]|uniref:Carbon-nitrogen hydrolase n=1 Tax=Geodermatophilus ruber TaxID=504800 RepID=A0A1I4H318_9ACTN|nr:carbon-nitrogen family hydrolase [Geodermatophilus ruber]SFL36585.1 Carbon-nitrogen hydrolase [Geodermatophilus ruber]